MANEPNDPIPGVDDAELAAAVQSLPSLPTTQADDADRFVREVRAIAEKRAQASWPKEDDSDVAAFVLAPHPREVGQRFNGKPVLDLLATDSPILGRLFFLSRDASRGRFIEFPTASPGEILDWLVDNGLGNYTLVMVYRSGKSLVARPRGAASDAESDSIRDTPPQAKATLKGLLDALKHFHRRKLLTPSVCPEGVWEPKRANEYVPGPAPEKSIQRSLTDALNFWFHDRVRAEMEDKTAIGRIDVRLLTNVKGVGPLSYWAIVERKVVKSYHNAQKKIKATPVSMTENAGAVADGVQQAWAYRNDRVAEEGLLEVYDLRKDKSEDVFSYEKVKSALATCTPPPTCNVRQVFGEAAHARASGYS